MVPRVLVTMLAVSGWAQDAATIEALLRQPVLDPMQPLVEVQVYTASRVPLLAVPRTAAEWHAYAGSLRQRVLDEVMLRGEARNWSRARTRVEWLETLPGEGYRVRKLRYEALPGLWIPALLYEPEPLSGKVLSVLNVNGHERDGLATGYIQRRCIHLAKGGALALNPEWFGRGQLDIPGFGHYRINQLDLLGTSGVAVHLLAQQRAVEVLLEHPHADPRRLAVTGLSGGGWQTIILSALDPRVALAVPVAGYSSFLTRAQWPDLDLGDSEQTPPDLAAVADYTHLTALLAPRPALLTFNAKDTCCFRADYAAAPLVQAAMPVYRLLNAPERLRHHVNHNAGHNYDLDNREAFYGMLREFLEPNFPTGERSRDSEVRPKEQLRVALPPGNATFHTLASDLLRKTRPAPGANGRLRLEQIVRARRYRILARESERSVQDGITATRWKLHLDGDWTVPALELTPANPQGAVLLAGDQGRAALVGQVRWHLEQHRRVVAIDPFYFGESKIAKRDFLFALLLASLGEPPLGVQASQIMAAARWLSEERKLGPVMLETSGPRSGLFGLVAAALEPAIAAVRAGGAMGSLREVIEKDLSADQTPELFCFGLLAEFDIPQIAALVAPRPLIRP